MNLDKSKAFRQVDLFEGKGEVLVWDLLGKEPAGQIKSILACALAPAGSVGAHRQADTDEVMVVLSGTGSAQIDEDVYLLEAGSVVHLPLGQFLQLKNASETEEMKYLIIKSAP